jgi:cytochrome c-type biogenesis protein CcmE
VDPGRKRKLRLAAALGAAVLLASALLYTSFNASTAARTPSEVLAEGEAGENYKLTGEVVDGSIERRQDGLAFEIRDREGDTAVPVDYSGIVPDPFREGREVIVSGTVTDGTFVAEKDSLVTKCPSKFADEAEADPEHVVIE